MFCCSSGGQMIECGSFDFWHWQQVTRDSWVTMISASSVKVNKEGSKSRGKPSNQVHPHPLDRFIRMIFESIWYVQGWKLKLWYTNSHVCMGCIYNYLMRVVCCVCILQMVVHKIIKMLKAWNAFTTHLIHNIVMSNVTGPFSSHHLISSIPQTKIFVSMRGNI